MDPKERTHRKVERTPEEQARLRTVRDRFQQERPTLDDLLATGDYSDPIPHGEYLELQALISHLRQWREESGLSLADVSDRSGIDRAALSRLETGRNANPTFATLTRYAGAL